MHYSTFITLATAATGALAGPLKRDTAETTTYACNPAHAYPNGAQCVSTNGALSLVTPTASGSTKPASTSAAATTYACNPAHSYPNGAQCVSTNGALSLVTPTASASSKACKATSKAASTTAAATTYACNPAHSYPGGAQCVSTNGALSLLTPTASAAATTYACNPAHAYPNGAQCVSTNGALSLVTPTASAAATSAEASKSSAAQSAASAVATKDASSGGQTKIDGLTWTVQDFNRYCSEDKTGCDYNFKLTSSDHKLETACTIIRTNVKDAPTENWSNIPCTTDSLIKVSWGYSAQFGADHAFATLVVVNDKEIGYFGIADVNSKPVTTTPSNPFGSGQFGNLGPNPVYHV